MAIVLKSKPGLSSATTLSIPKDWDATWFRNLINNQLKGADVRNAVGSGGIVVSGTIASPYATIGFGAPVTLPGPVTITAPSGGGVALTVQSTSAFATAIFGDIRLGLNVGLSGSGSNIYTTASALAIGSTAAVVVNFFTNGLSRLAISSAGLLAAPASPLQPAITQVVTGLAAFKSVATTSANNTLATDAALTLTFNELGWYQIEIFLPVFEATSGAGGFQWNFLNGGTAGFANLRYEFSGFSNAAIAVTAAQTSPGVANSMATVSTSSVAPSWVAAKGVLQITSGGTAGIQWAQAATLGADPTTLMAGAYVIATKIG